MGVFHVPGAVQEMLEPMHVLPPVRSAPANKVRIGFLFICGTYKPSVR